MDRGRWSVVVDEVPKERTLIAARAKELRRTAIVTGDFVDLVGTLRCEGYPGAHCASGRAHLILRRSADDTDRRSAWSWRMLSSW